jgi:aldose 1-epimerase
MTDADELVRIAGGPIEVEVLPAIGARLYRLRAFGHDLLRTPDDLRPHLDDPYFYGSYPMAPWCNRVPAGPAVVAGREIDLPASFPDGTAIHGQVARRAWDVVGDGTFRVVAGGDGWPWAYEVEQRVAIRDHTLRLSLRLTNRSADPMPGGIGFHPWFRRPVEVAIAAASVHPSNHATEARPVPVSGALDRRRLTVMPDGLDATWADLSDPPVVLHWPETGIRATMAVEAPTRFIVAATLPGTDAVAVEPQTHAPDGLRRLANSEPGGLALLEAGESLELTASLAFERIGPDREPARQT